MNNYGKSLVAHRGFSAAYPENTLLAVESALALGACFIEVDVHLSADHVPIVIHDANLQRTAGKDVNVLDLPFSQLEQYSLHEPQRFANRYLPQRMPSLQSVVELIRGYPKRTVFVEAKRASIKRFGIEAFLNAVTVAVENLPGRCVLISFDSQLLATAKQRCLCPVGWVIENWGEGTLKLLDGLCPDYVFTDTALVPEQWEVMPNSPWQWVVYTIDEAQLALQWFQRGAALVETNDFGALIKHPSLNKVC